MNKVHYSISDAAKELHVETHVLRYWEEELHLSIPRNQMGHRTYGESEMALLKQIIQWKEQGLSLKEIECKCGHASAKSQDAVLLQEMNVNRRQVIPYRQDETALMSGTGGGPAADIRKRAQVSPQVARNVHSDPDGEKMQQFKQILGRIVTDAIHENSAELSTDIAAQVSDHVNKELDFLFREREEADEAHFKQLDETLRALQKARQEAAAAQAPALPEYKTKRRRFRKKNKQS